MVDELDEQRMNYYHLGFLHGVGAMGFIFLLLDIFVV